MENDPKATSDDLPCSHAGGLQRKKKILGKPTPGDSVSSQTLGKDRISTRQINQVEGLQPRAKASWPCDDLGAPEFPKTRAHRCNLRVIP